MKFGDREVSRIGLGTNRLTPTPKNIELIRTAVASGVHMIDTAHLYQGGRSEETIGAALSPMPEGVTVATKGGFGGAGRGRPEVLRAEIDQSLRSLRVDRIELYYLHRVDPETPLETSLTAIEEYRVRGKIRQIGISDVTVEQIERARRVAPIVAVQNEYNLAQRKHEAVVDYCTAEGIVFVPFFPLRDGGGPAVDAIARRHHATSHQVLLAWLLRRSPIMLPIPGTLSEAHLKENIGALEVQLTDAEYRSLA